MTISISSLSELPLSVAVWSLVFFAVVAVHEVGHYLAGLAIGVPSRSMKIRLLAFPQHVALRDGDEWVSPSQLDHYLKIAEPLMPTRGRALIFVAGGFVLETVALLIWVTQRLPLYREALTLALWMTAFYVLADVAIYLRTRKAGMDFSAMISISPVLGSMIGLAVIGTLIYLATSLGQSR